MSVHGTHAELLPCSDIKECTDAFKARNLPLHGLINNVGVENPGDRKSKEGFDVSPSSVAADQCCESTLYCV